MTMFDCILTVLGAVIVLPFLAFLCVKLGTVGFYRGKEIVRRQHEFDDFQNDNDSEETEELKRRKRNAKE